MNAKIHVPDTCWRTVPFSEARRRLIVRLAIEGRMEPDALKSEGRSAESDA